MQKLTYGQALREAIYDEMAEDSDIVFMGEDIRYNLYGYSEGLWEEFGDHRVLDTPLSEAAVVGAAIGASMCGVRAIVDLTVSNFLYVAMDQIVDMAAKIRYQCGGQYKVPMTIIVSSVYGVGAGTQHSDRPHPMFMNVGGIKVVIPSTPQDMYSLLRRSIREENPVLFFWDKTLFYKEGDVDKNHSIAIGKSAIVKEGDEVTVFAIGGCVGMAMEAATICESKGISVRIVDVRTLAPLDAEMILHAVKETGKVVIVDFANKICSAASEIASIIAESGFHWLQAPIKIIACETMPLPYSKKLEAELIPSVGKIKQAIEMVYEYNLKETCTER